MGVHPFYKSGLCYFAVTIDNDNVLAGMDFTSEIILVFNKPIQKEIGKGF
jgi:hypothetical protein